MKSLEPRYIHEYNYTDLAILFIIGLCLGFAIGAGAEIAKHEACLSPLRTENGGA